MRRIFLYLVLITVGITNTRGQESATPLSLAECMNYAMTHNYSVKNAKVDVSIQQAQIKQNISAAYPHINGKAEFDDYLVPQSSFIDASTFPSSDPNAQPIPKGTIVPISFTVPYAGSASATATQVIFDGSVLVALKARNTVLELAKANSSVTEETVRYNVYKAYNAMVIAYRQYDIVKGTLKYARTNEHDLEVTRQNGLAEKIEVERASVQVNNLASDSIRIGNLLTTSEQTLKYQIGMNINTPIILTDTALEDRRESVLALLNEEEHYNRVPEFNVAMTGLKVNEYNVDRYRMAAIPTLNAFFSYGTNYGSTKFSDIMQFNKYWSNETFGIQLSVPIFNGFMRQNQVAEAKLNVEKSHNNIENLKQTLDYQSAQSRTSLKNAVLQAQNQRRNLELAADVLDLAQKKYKAGVGSNLEVTQAQNDQLQAQNSYFSTMLDVVNAEADLKKALGLLGTTK